jgi:DNA primase
VLGRSLDELAPQSRRLLGHIKTLVDGECKRKAMEPQDFRFTRWDLRLLTSWSDTALKVHLRRLCDLEYLAVHRGVGQSFAYELLYRGEGEGGGRFALGLLDVEPLTHAYDGPRSGQNEGRSAPGQGPVSPRSGGGPDGETMLPPNENKASNDLLLKRSRNADQEGKATPSHHNGIPLSLAASA